VWSHMQTLLTGDPTPNAYFGNGVSIQGGWIAVGGYFLDKMQGQVYLYRLVEDVWVQHSVLDCVDGFGSFGYSVSLGGAGPEDPPGSILTLAVGNIVDADYVGGCLVYRLVEGEGEGDVEWQLLQGLTPVQRDNEEQPMYVGWSVSTDGASIAVGSLWTHGYVVVWDYDTEGGVYTETLTLSGVDIPTMGDGNTVSVSNGVLAIGTYTAGEVYVYTKQEQGEGDDATVVWNKVQTLSDTDGFGVSVAISGNTLVVGSYNHENPSQSLGVVKAFTQLEDSTFTSQWSGQSGLEGTRMGMAVAVSGTLYQDLAVIAGGQYYNENTGMVTVFGTSSLVFEALAGEGIVRVSTNDYPADAMFNLYHNESVHVLGPVSSPSATGRSQEWVSMAEWVLPDEMVAVTIETPVFLMVGVPASLTVPHTLPHGTSTRITAVRLAGSDYPLGTDLWVGVGDPTYSDSDSDCVSGHAVVALSDEYLVAVLDTPIDIGGEFQPGSAGALLPLPVYVSTDAEGVDIVEIGMGWVEGQVDILPVSEVVSGSTHPSDALLVTSGSTEYAVCQGVSLSLYDAQGESVFCGQEGVSVSTLPVETHFTYPADPDATHCTLNVCLDSTAPEVINVYYQGQSVLAIPVKGGTPRSNPHYILWVSVLCIITALIGLVIWRCVRKRAPSVSSTPLLDQDMDTIA
ncbi:hypothetical protein KIPB_005388, partial [Kipferlia bialata]